MFRAMKRTTRQHPVRTRRRELGLSGYALAKRLGISQSHLREIETGAISAPRVPLALAIADALQSDVKALFPPKAEAA